MLSRREGGASRGGEYSMSFGQDFCQNPHPQTTCFVKVYQKSDFSTY